MIFSALTSSAGPSRWHAVESFGRLARKGSSVVRCRLCHEQRSNFSTSSSRLRDQGWPGETEQDIEERRGWVEEFSEAEITKDALDFSFARSSGPGGQHVNKTSSKALIKLDLARATAKSSSQASPSGKEGKIGSHDRFLLSSITSRLPYYVPSAHSLQFSSMLTRSQDQNLQDAIQKMHAHILEVGSSNIPGETSEAQRRKVVGLMSREKNKILTSKKRRSATKNDRRARYD